MDLYIGSVFLGPWTIIKYWLTSHSVGQWDFIGFSFSNLPPEDFELYFIVCPFLSALFFLHFILTRISARSAVIMFFMFVE